MRIWIFNNYNTLPEHGALTRSYNFGKFLKELGHDPVVFVGSHPHNSSLQLINDKKKYLQYENCNFPWVFVKTCNYENSKIKRVYSMFQYYKNLKKAVKHYDKPDAIIGSSAHPFAAVAAIKHANKYQCQGIVEIRDLWPESIVAYGVVSKKNPLVRILYRLEKWIYTKADKIIFTMEGGRDYIIEKGWDKGHGGPVDLHKVYHINNGVDLEAFDYNKEHYTFPDPDLDDPNTFKVVYTGSIRRVNDIKLLVDTAECLKPDTKIKLIVYGDGDELETLKKNAAEQGLNNIRFKGKIDKKNIPYIISKSDLCLLHWHPTVCGLSQNISTAAQYAECIEKVATMSNNEYQTYCDNARRAAEDYDFRKLSAKLIEVLRQNKE